MENAVRKVQQRLERAAAVLEKAGVPYAIVGGNAVAAWVARVDEAAVRHTQDVDILIRRSDLETAKAAMSNVGFVFRHVRGVDMFLDGPGAKARDAVHVVFSGEKVRPEYLAPEPNVDEVDTSGSFRVLSLDARVRRKLTFFRLKDQVHLQDLVGVGLLDESWLEHVPSELAPRSQEILENPDK